MSSEKGVKRVHPLGEGIETAEEYPPVHRVDTFGGPVYVEWTGDAGVSLQGPLTYFVEFLKASSLWQRFVDACPLRYTSRNAPKKEEILGAILFSVLSGHRDPRRQRVARRAGHRDLSQRGQYPARV
jgi:hypothetical protein